MKRVKKVVAAMFILMVLLCMPMQTFAERSLNKSWVKISTGSTVNLKLSNAKYKIQWKSSKPSVASVSSKGVVKGKKLGVSYVTATYKGKTYRCIVKIAPRFRKGTWLLGTNGGFVLDIHEVMGNKFTFSSRVLNVSCSNVTAYVNKSGKTATASFRCPYGYRHYLKFTWLGDAVKVKETSSCYRKLMAPLGSSSSTVEGTFRSKAYWENVMRQYY